MLPAFMYSFVPFVFSVKVVHAVFRCSLLNFHCRVTFSCRTVEKELHDKLLFPHSAADGYWNCIQRFGSYEQFC